MTKNRVAFEIAIVQAMDFVDKQEWPMAHYWLNEALYYCEEGKEEDDDLKSYLPFIEKAVRKSGAALPILTRKQLH